MPDAPLTPDEERELHRRLLDNDATAPSDLASAFLDALVGWVRRTNRKIDDAICVQAAEDAVLALIKNPSAFRTDGSLWGYLRMAAQGDLKNAVARERRQRKRHIRLDSVEETQVGGKYLSRKGNVVLTLIRAEDVDDVERRILPCAKRNLPDAECAALDLMLSGERRTAAFAGVLGITDLPRSEQRIRVKRLKDKLTTRLKRCREEEA